MCVLLALAAPLAVMAQQTVFNDTFGTSSLNQTPIAGGIPGGIPTASQTSYTISSAKSALTTTIGSGHFDLNMSASGSGNNEAQAVFTQHPVTLLTNGDYVELTYTFTCTTDVMQSISGTSDALFMGLYNSGGVPPQSGTNLANSGYSSSLVNADVGGVVNWVGYAAQMYDGTGWTLLTRPAQSTVANNMNQGLVYNYASGITHGGGTAGSPGCIIGSQYTCQLRITLSNTLANADALVISNAFYLGASTASPCFYTNVWTIAAGTSYMGTNYDSLAIGYRATDGTSKPGWTNDINSITVVAGLANQPGPYFSITTSGNGCGGGNTIGLNGSVTTNVYFLYTNNVNSGQSVLGTGSTITFGFQTIQAIYTVIASNTVTGIMGPMYGTAGVFVGVPVINSEPASVVCATNVPATFSVKVSGNSLTFQWYKNGIALTNGGDISGANSTNLVISPTQAADAAATASGYYIVARDACGNSTTSAPNASLTLVPPNNLVWQGNNNNGTWDLTNTLNFTNLFGASEEFTNGDIVTFNDSGNTSVTISNSVIPTLTRVVASQSYNFGGSGQLTGFGQLVVGGSGTLTIANANTYTGGTIVSNGATLSLGNGGGVIGSVGGTVTVNTGGTLQYNYAGSGTANGPVNLNEALAGSGTVNYMDQNGSILATPLNAVSSNFNGTINVQGSTSLHASDGNAGYAVGNGSTINAPDGSQIWLDRSATAYNSTFNIGGTGWIGVIPPAPQTGALRVYGNIVNGNIHLLDNARIGGTINGATLQGVISGPYQMEVFGTTNSYILVMGPTNGASQAYASTLITSGAISAAGTNAISSGPLTVDAGGDMRLNGYNITVSNLSSANSGANTLIEGPRVRNLNTGTTNATLTVGTDGTSTEFDGTFSDGGTTNGWFGLTKVGAGTLTLTLLNSNTGPVTVLGGSIKLNGSASFGKASPISVGSGATLNVSGRSDGTLTLSNAQTLAGNGSVNGILVAPLGTRVNPGFPMGTLTVSGNVTLGGTLVPNLNRTNTPSNCSKLASSGSITYGGTLGVTNVGPKLQVGDVFQLFTGANAGFTGYALQTNDVPNNAVYVWSNSVAADGKITLTNVSYLVSPFPTNITVSVSGTNVALSWPLDHKGWMLQAQTNSLAIGLSTNWANVPNSTLTNVVFIPMIKTNGAVFYRLTGQFAF